jgi:predicted HAD superfamily Cof-like phosphohydrolase
MDYQKDIAEFMEKAGQKVNYSPVGYLDSKTKELRVRLLLEEVLELAKASGVSIRSKSGDEISDDNFGDLKFSTSEDLDMVEVCDALADITYVLFGAGCSYGIKISEAFEECHNSNMSKFIDGHRDENTGKWIKGPSYRVANFQLVLNNLIEK